MLGTFKTWLGIGSLLVAFPAMAQPFHHEFGEWRLYSRDWLAACPDTINEDALDYYGTHCFASTGTSELNDANLPAYKMTILLDRLDGVLDVAFTASPTAGTVLDETRPLIIDFTDSPPMTLEFGSDLETRYNTSNMYFVASSDQKSALLDAMRDRNAASVTVPLVGGNGAQTAELTFSMRGVLASIDFMQAYSRRIEGYDQ